MFFYIFRNTIQNYLYGLKEDKNIPCGKPANRLVEGHIIN